MLLPTANTALNRNIEFTEQSSHTFRFDMDNDFVYNFADGREAMKQAIYLILSIERYKYAILPWNYGVELEDLFGMPISWVIPEVKRRIEEALIQDSRIKFVDSFEFETGKRTLLVLFTAHTIYGDIPFEKAVNF